VHRDIKPANIMLLAGDQIKICDFGIAWFDGATVGLTTAGSRIGTFAYIARAIAGWNCRPPNRPLRPGLHPFPPAHGPCPLPSRRTPRRDSYAPGDAAAIAAICTTRYPSRPG
jgi:serine/threonine protein kinase